MARYAPGGRLAAAHRRKIFEFFTVYDPPFINGVRPDLVSGAVLVNAKPRGESASRRCICALRFRVLARAERVERGRRCRRLFALLVARLIVCLELWRSMRGADPVLCLPTIRPAACALLLLATVGPREIAGMKGDERFRTESTLYLVQQFCFDDGVPPSTALLQQTRLSRPLAGMHAASAPPSRASTRRENLTTPLSPKPLN